MSLHAFVDESRRNNTYLLAAAVVLPRELNKMRKILMGLRFPNQRELHFKKETPARRIPDVVGWCYGADGDWLRRVRPLLSEVVDLRLP